MTTTGLYETDDEQQHHWRAIETVARDLHRPVEGVRALYEAELASLLEEARVKDFLSVLASRSVRLQLKSARWQ